jgi:hypothetical protein
VIPAPYASPSWVAPRCSRNCFTAAPSACCSSPDRVINVTLSKPTDILTQAAFDLVRLSRVIARIDIGLHREEHPLRRLFDVSENCLASDHDNLAFARDLRRHSDDVIELVSRTSDLLEDLAPLRLAQQSGKR